SHLAAAAVPTSPIAITPPVAGNLGNWNGELSRGARPKHRFLRLSRIDAMYLLRSEERRLSQATIKSKTTSMLPLPETQVRKRVSFGHPPFQSLTSHADPANPQKIAIFLLLLLPRPSYVKREALCQPSESRFV